jgi:hypothetical protein
MSMAQGERGLHRQTRAGPAVIVVNETFARRYFRRETRWGESALDSATRLGGKSSVL